MSLSISFAIIAISIFAFMPAHADNSFVQKDFTVLTQSELMNTHFKFDEQEKVKQALLKNAMGIEITYPDKSLTLQLFPDGKHTKHIVYKNGESALFEHYRDGWMHSVIIEGKDIKEIYEYISDTEFIYTRYTPLLADVPTKYPVIELRYIDKDELFYKEVYEYGEINFTHHTDDKTYLGGNVTITREDFNGATPYIGFILGAMEPVTTTTKTCVYFLEGVIDCSGKSLFEELIELHPVRNSGTP